MRRVVRLLSYVRLLAGGKHYRSESADLLHGPQLQRAYKKNHASRLVLLITSGVQEDKEKKRNKRVCDGHVCLSSSKVKINTKILIQQKQSRRRAAFVRRDQLEFPRL